MRALRNRSIRHARGLETFYRAFAAVIYRLHPLWRLLGYARIDKPIATIERGIKGLLFDCKMCGNCALSSTGMSCPMNCPKQLRNGPCGGVRANGNCEVIPTMPCVWVAAVRGSQRMRHGDKITDLQPPLNWSQQNTSAWLREVRQKRAAETTEQANTATPAQTPTPPKPN